MCLYKAQITAVSVNRTNGSLVFRLDQRTGQYKYLFMIGIVEVCLDAWLLVLGFSKSTYYLCRSRFLSKYEICINAKLK